MVLVCIDFIMYMQGIVLGKNDKTMTTEINNMIVEPIRENGLVQISSEATTASPEASSTASDSPTPTNSVHEKNWPSHWQGLGK